jgi:hypothetical protein
MSFSLDIKPQSIGASAGVDGAGVDMKGWDGVLFILALGVIDGTQDMKAQGDDNSSFTSATDITDAAITQVAGTGDNKAYLLDVWRPTERYIRSRVDNGAGAVADFQAVIAMRYRATGRLPLTQHADIGELIKVAVN